MTHNEILLIAGILSLGIFCQWISWRLKMPAILPLLAAGFLVGPIMGWVNPQEFLGHLFFPTVSLLVSIILFEGALTLKWKEVRSVASTVRNLITIGAFITWLGGMAAAYFLLDIRWEIAMLFGALIVVTGPTVIAPLLRNVRPTARIASVLKWEGILIDPLGALLAVLVFNFIVAEGEVGELGTEAILGFLTIVGTGTLIGLLGGFIVSQMLKRYLVPDYLRDVTILALVILAFAASDSLQSESGLLAVTVMGIYLANDSLYKLHEVWYFKEKLSVLFISVLFIILAANISMAELQMLDMRSLLVLVIVLVVLRPLGVQISALGSSLSMRERLFLSWIAPRGIVAAAVSALFAFRLKEFGFPGAELLEPLVFMVIVGTVVLQGFSAKLFARLLGVAEAEPQGFLLMGATPFSIELAETLMEAGFTTRIVDMNRGNVRDAQLQGLEVYEGNILSEFTETDVDLSGIGRLLALTSNDEANALACLHLEDEFGSSKVYQLVPKMMATHRDSKIPTRYRLSRLLFAEGATFQQLNQIIQDGSRVKKTSLTEQFSYQDLLEQQTTDFIPLLAYRKKIVTMATTEQEFLPQAGWTVVSLVAQPEESTTTPIAQLGVDAERADMQDGSREKVAV